MTPEALARLWHDHWTEVAPGSTWAKPFDKLKPENRAVLVEVARRSLADLFPLAEVR